MRALRTFSLILACISFIIVIGGATYEHLAVVPLWSAAVPASLAMFQGEYGLAPQRFWIPIHPVTLVLLVAALVLNWRTFRRNFIVIALGGYFVALLATFAFFVPELMELTKTSFSAVVDPELTRRAHMWEALSLLRLSVLIIMSIILLLGLSKPADARTR